MTFSNEDFTKTPSTHKVQAANVTKIRDGTRDESNRGNVKTQSPNPSEFCLTKTLGTESEGVRDKKKSVEDMAAQSKLSAEEIQNPAAAPPPPPPPSVDEAIMKKRAAAARAYALSGGSSKKKKVKSKLLNQVYTIGGTHVARMGTTAGEKSQATERRGATTHSSHPSHSHRYSQYPYPPPLPHHAYPHFPAHPQYAYHLPHQQMPMSPGRHPRPPYPSPYGPLAYPYPLPPNAAAPQQDMSPASHPTYPSSKHAAHVPLSSAASTRSNHSTELGHGYSPNLMEDERRQIAKNHHQYTDQARPQQTKRDTSRLSHDGVFNLRIPSASERLAAYSAAQAKTLPEGLVSPAAGSNISNPLSLEAGEEDDDYAKFVKSLGLLESDNDLSLKPEDEDEDEEEEFQLDLDDEEEGEEDDGDEEEADDGERDDGNETNGANSSARDGVARICVTKEKKKHQLSIEDLPDWDPNFYQELEEELGNLEEEDLEAAVASLLGTTSTAYAHSQKQEGYSGIAGHEAQGDLSPFSSAKAERKTESSDRDLPEKGVSDKERVSVPLSSPLKESQPPATPLGHVKRTKTVVSARQLDRLQRLLMQHFQLLVQQAVLAIRAAHLQRTQRIKDKTEFLSGESGDDLVEVLDGAISMVQDLNQNRKDAIRNAIQFEETGKGCDQHVSARAAQRGERVAGRRRPCSSEKTVSTEAEENVIHTWQRRLTRAAFSETLKRHTGSQKNVFDVRGLHRLQETFHALDHSSPEETNDNRDGSYSEPEYTKVCRSILQQAEAVVDEAILPGTKDLSENFSNPAEYLGETFEKPCDDDQVFFLRKSRNLFSAGEDNLVLRGVNLYGEKQWILIADRYLPDRSVNVISQRYSKLCVMLYKANGINIDAKGNLDQPPRLESVEDIDDAKVALIPKATPPAILNVHRWSLEEDLTLLRAVPLMGHMWAELGARLVPHRDRGHLRKRYQVLERRVKATISRSFKNGLPMAETSMAKQSSNSQQRQPQHSASQRTMLTSNVMRATLIGGNTNKLLTSNRATLQPQNELELISPSLKGGSSRTAFEMLVGDNTADWSQMSRIKEMIENDAELESEIVGALASRLTKSPSKIDGEQTRRSSKGGSIMANVLERSQGLRQKPIASEKKKEKIPGARSGSTSNSATTTSKDQQKDSDMTTPKSQQKAETNDNSGSASANSPAEDSVMDSIGVGLSMDSMSLGNFDSRQVLEYARAQGSHVDDQDVPSKAFCSPTKISFLNGPLMEENDLEAISALNSLSNSPARSLLKSSATERARRTSSAARRVLPTSSRKRALSTNTPKTTPKTEAKEEDKSFFHKVLGGVHERDSKKKRLKF